MSQIINIPSNYLSKYLLFYRIYEPKPLLYMLIFTVNHSFYFILKNISPLIQTTLIVDIIKKSIISSQ